MEAEDLQGERARTLRLSHARLAAFGATRRRGPVTESIQRTFFDATSGRDARYTHWLRHVAVQTVSSY